jgi:hypothetical protein
MIGQDVTGYREVNGRLVAQKRKVRDPAWLGPGRYDPNVESTGDRGHTMKESYRTLHKYATNGIPGPGAYETREFDMRSAPQSRQSVRSDPPEQPPKGGEMDQPVWQEFECSHSSAPFRSRTRRELWKKRDGVPSPDSYQSTKTARTQPATAAFGKRSPRFEPAGIQDVPGPGAYHASEYKWASAKRPSSGRRADEHEVIAVTPGPGEYEPHKNTWESPKTKPNPVFATTLQRGHNDETFAPGPGTYDVTPSKTARRPSIHTSRLRGFNFYAPDPNNPGPFEYQRELTQNKQKGRTIGQDSRFAQTTDAGVPGPGSYETSGRLVKKSFNAELVGKL